MKNIKGQWLLLMISILRQLQTDMKNIMGLINTVSVELDMLNVGNYSADKQELPMFAVVSVGDIC